MAQSNALAAAALLAGTALALVAVTPSCATPEGSIAVDAREAEDTRAWLEDAAQVCREWIPRIQTELDGAPGSEPVDVLLVAKAEYEAPAATAGSTIYVQAEGIRRDPTNIGMVIHELVHVLQRYRSPTPGWVVEGVADWVRYYVFQPGTNQRFDPRAMDYTRGYWPASAFLDWIRTTRDPGIVRALHADARAGRYRDGIFRERTGRSLDELWQEFARAERPEFRSSANGSAQTGSP